MNGRPDPEDERALEVIAARYDLTPWEEDLLEALSEQGGWSVKQGAAFDRLWEEKMGGES